MEDSNHEPGEPRTPEQSRGWREAFLAFLPSIAILMATTFGWLKEPFIPISIAAYLVFNAMLSFIASRRLFRGHAVLIGFVTLGFMVLNIVISFFIGCVTMIRLGH